ncbi:cell division protein ZapA [Parabacteroides sp. ZJ-118]|uniref:cell division protein ZapA n=1 Tax=Parabacteroides sp. ZJ-118 TaxID=2709398 RepID=UPI0013EAD659|nr:cell division protein ZapA [Parabacteroides sp. ZJ-118]
MDEEFLINIDIAGKKYPLLINRAREELYRKAAKSLQSKVFAYSENYNKNGELDTKDLLAMAAFDLALQNVELRERNETSPFTDKIQELTTELEGYLKK